MSRGVEFNKNAIDNLKITIHFACECHNTALLYFNQWCCCCFFHQRFEYGLIVKFCPRFCIKHTIFNSFSQNSFYISHAISPKMDCIRSRCVACEKWKKKRKLLFKWQLHSEHRWKMTCDDDTVQVRHIFMFHVALCAQQLLPNDLAEAIRNVSTIQTTPRQRNRPKKEIVLFLILCLFFKSLVFICFRFCFFLPFPLNDDSNIYNIYLFVFWSWNYGLCKLHASKNILWDRYGKQVRT